MPSEALPGTAKTTGLISGGRFPHECTSRKLSQKILLCALRTCTCAVSPHNWSDLVHLTDVPCNQNSWGASGCCWHVLIVMICT
jgi:hypothetical protein